MRWLLWAIVVCLPSAEVGLVPAFVRVDLAPQDVRHVSFTITAQPGDTVTAVMADCACIRIDLSVPAPIPAEGRLVLPLRVTGVRPGVESVAVHTTRGTATAHLQIAGPGAGRGSEVLAAAVAQARRERLHLWAIVHDLGGTVRNCGCSQGSLGGAAILAALPAAVPDVPATWVLTGDVDGKQPGVGAALAGHGWQVGHPAVAVAADPAGLLAQPDLVAVVVPQGATINHRRIVQPALPKGMAAQLLLVTPEGIVREQRVLPIDPSLPAEPAFAARFPERLSVRLDTVAVPSQACAGCHAEAMRVWSGSNHAHALARLPVADQHDGCIGCHTTPMLSPQPPAVVAAEVHCQACHPGAEAHAVTPTVKPPPASDCRTCHDVQHHPTFDRAAAWQRIRHGR
jgi:hypothetical protein